MKELWEFENLGEEGVLLLELAIFGRVGLKRGFICGLGVRMVITMFEIVFLEKEVSWSIAKFVRVKRLLPYSLNLM